MQVSKRQKFTGTSALRKMCRILLEPESRLRRGSEAIQNANNDISALFMCYGLKVLATTLLIDLLPSILTFPVLTLL